MSETAPETTTDSSFTPEENAFFESGGNSPIPSDTGTANTGDGSETATATDKDGAAAAETAAKTDKAPSHVPLAALHEERNRRKAIDVEFRKTQTELAELRGKFSILDRLVAPADNHAREPQLPPTPEEDIFGNVKHVGETVAQLAKRLDDADAERKQKTENDTFISNYRSDAAKFSEKTPDFMDAYNFLLNTRAEELKAIGYDTPETLHNALMADEMGIAQLALSKGKSAAEMFYTLAKQRGYAVKPGPDGAKDITPSKGAAMLDTIEKGQAANKSLANTGGSAGDPDMTAQALMDMDLGEFEAWCAKNPAKAKRIMGG